MALKQNGGTGRDPWEDDYFIDISSHSSLGMEQPPSRPTGERREEERRRERTQRPQSESGRARPPKRGQAPKRPGPSGSIESHRSATPARKPQNRDRDRSPEKKGSRRAMLAVTLLTMVVVTALLCVFLLFKVSDIEITGDKVYEDRMILEICDYRIGDNLVFLSTGDREQALKEELPYIRDVEIKRRFPGTLEIQISGAQVTSCVSSGNTWLYASAEGKILEQKYEPAPGVMQVTGLSPLDTKPGKMIRVEDETQQNAYDEITSQIAALDGAASFTSLDLSDLYDIKLWYEDRIEFKLGSSASLSYKVEFGWRIVTDPEQIGVQERGVLDLSYAEEGKRANFTAEAALASPSPSPPSEPSPDGEGPASSGPEEGPDPAGTEPPAIDRDFGIPDTPFTGE